MNIKSRISMSVAVLGTVGAIAFMPVSADDRDNVAQFASGTIVAQVTVAAAATETAQDQVWDMTYGEQQPATVVEESAQPAQDEGVVDYTFG